MWKKRMGGRAKPALVAVSLAVASLVAQGCGDRTPETGVRRPAPAEEHPPLRIALAREPLCALLALAVERGYLAEEGVAAKTVDHYPSGKVALAGLLEGEVDVAPCAETPIVFRSFERQDFRIVATLGVSDNEPRVVARRDRGIGQPADLRGKRVATQRASAVHYFLYLFLLRHGMSEADVDLSFLTAEELPDALGRGTIDAFSMREPFVGKAQALVGEDAVVFAEPGLYVKTFNLVVREDLVASRPEMLRALLRALLRAETFARRHPADAIEALADWMGTDRAIVGQVWPELELRVSLGQGLLGVLEDQARWAMQRGFIEAERAPNYLDFVDPEPLAAVKPGAVTLIR